MPPSFRDWLIFGYLDGLAPRRPFNRAPRNAWGLPLIPPYWLGRALGAARRTLRPARTLAWLALLALLAFLCWLLTRRDT